MTTQRLRIALRSLIVAFCLAWNAAQIAEAQQTVDTENHSAEEVTLLKTARNLHNRSRHHYDYGRYAEAIADIEQAKQIIERVEGPDSPLVTTFINNLAYYYKAKGELGPVEGLLRDVVERTKQETGEGSLDVAMAELHLGNYWIDRGLAREAEELFSGTLALLESKPGDLNARRQLPNVLRKLAELRAERGVFEEAESMFLRALTLSEELFGKDHQATGDSVNALALFYSVHAGRFEEAEALFKRLLALLEPLGDATGRVWAVQENLGMLYLRSAQFEQAESILTERYEFERGDPFLEEMGSPKLAHSASRLGELYWAMGKMEQALPLWAEAGERYARHENATLAIGNEQERLLYAAGLVDNVNAMLSMHLFSAPDNPAGAEMAMLRVLRTKGRVSEAQADTYRVIREGLSAEGKAQIHRLGELRGALAYWTRTETERDRAENARQEIAEIESRLAESSASLTDINDVLQLAELRESLPGDAALVEFVRFQPFDIASREHREPRYAAYVLTQDGAPVGFDLGAASRIEASVDRLREALAGRDSMRDLSNELHAAVVNPWLSKLDAKQHLILAPDGLLNLLPFEVLGGAEGRRLLETHTITYLNCGRQLTGLRKLASSSNASVVVGDPVYGVRAEAPSGVAGQPGTGPEWTQATHWERLPGTAQEARLVHGLLEGSRLLVEEDAKEQALKALDSPRVLHIATHGFFLGASGVGAPEAARGLVVVGNHAKQQLQSSWRTMDNPLLQSGLVFAGANRLADEHGDGLLTALEATGLDLVGTQLVVMSACETGVGEVTSGEGVFGLRRAMELAGAESQVLSLWQVSDEATTELMKHFYTALVEGKTRAAALREARLALAASESWKHPYYWGAFILSGNWNALRP